jgi:diadenosine tetraphosphate (Ap4A) HIT family hydrolase
MWNRSVEHIHIHFIPGRLQWKYLRKMLENQGYPIHQELDINEKKYVK